MTNIDYTSIDAEEEKDPLDYHYTERRAELLDLIFQAGSPRRLNTTQLADRYGVTRSQIYQDYDALGDFIEGTLGDRAALRTRALHERVIGELLDEGEWRDAWTTHKEFVGWLADVGAIETVPDRLDATVTHSEEETETGAYKIVDDADDAIQLSDDGADEATEEVDQ